MQSFQPHFLHFVGDRVSAIAGQTIDACADKEMRTDILRSTEQFIDVALTVADVNATLTADFTGLPAGWTTPVGGGKHLKTVLVVDALGRTTKTTDPVGNTDYFTFAPGLNPRPKPKPPGVGPHGLPPRTLPASLVKAAWWLVCYTLGYALTIHPALARSSLVINHRYLLDALVDPLRYRYNGPLGLLRFIWRVAPRPHLVILLDAPAEVVRGRKQELALEEIRRQRDAYRALVEPLACGRVVDASRPIGEVVAEVDRVILTYLAERTAGRFRLEWERLPFLRA